MLVKQTDNTVILENINYFDPIHIFECGQCFRWEQQEDGSYTGIAFDRVINVKKTGKNIVLKNTDSEDFNAVWKHYFDLETDYHEIQNFLSHESVMKSALEFGYGIRILNQDLWECILSFILSANNNIPRIKGIIKSFCELFGDKIVFEGKMYYTFPKANQLKGIELGDLKLLRAGYRDKYIIDAIEKVNEGQVDLGLVRSLPLADARAEIMKIKGVGPKVADCILLFGAQRHDSFPVDVWVRRVMERLYTKELKESSILDFVNKTFGKYAGFAQQYLFYYIREVGENYEKETF